MTEFTHLCKVLIGMDVPRTRVTESELRLLRKYAAGARVIVEVGCFEGHAAGALAESTSGHVFTMDIFPRARLGVSCSEWIARWGRLKGGLRTNLTILRGSSEDVAAGFDAPIDLLILDADRSGDGAQRDWMTWTPKVGPGGVIAVRDGRHTSNPPHRNGSARFFAADPKSMRAVDPVEGLDSLAVFRKRTSVPPLSRVELSVNLNVPGKAA